MRRVGGGGIADILVLVLLAGASQNAMAGGYRPSRKVWYWSASIVGWNVLFDWLAFRFHRFARFVDPPAVALNRNGRNLRREFVTRDELMQQLRTNGIEDVPRRSNRSCSTNDWLKA
jgi:uncharacterized membrane protein YcaP (DUF421 family)